MTKSQEIILYGVPFSQPVRAVMWLLIYKGTPFTMKLTNPGSKGDRGSRNRAYLEKNPAGTIPMIEEPDTGFTLAEAHAIMAYLCNKNGWTDVYPSEPRARSRVDWYLHFHHRNVRNASVGLVAPRVREDLDIPQAIQDNANSILKSALRAIDGGWLRDREYLAGDRVTLADFAAYVEIGQLQPKFNNLLDFSPYPNVTRWLKAMAEVEGHDDVHTALVELGDISQAYPSLDTLKSANKTALARLTARLDDLRAF